MSDKPPLMVVDKTSNNMTLSQYKRTDGLNKTNSSCSCQPFRPSAFLLNASILYPLLLRSKLEAAEVDFQVFA